MWTPLSASRWICLLTLAVVMLFSASEVDSNSIYPSCCKGGNSKEIKVQINKCYEQKSQRDCRYNAFLIITKMYRQLCINSDAEWLKDKIEQGLRCPSVISKRRFEVLDEDDVE